MNTYEQWCEGNGLGPVLAAVREGAGDAPCCHWGTKAWMWERVAVLEALAVGDGGGDLFLSDGTVNQGVVDSVVSAVVNDHSGTLAGMVVSCRHAYPSDWMAWVEVEDFFDGDETLTAIDEALNAAAELMTRCSLPVGLSFNPWDITLKVMWARVFDYWDEKEGEI